MKSFLLQYWYKVGFLIMPDLYKETLRHAPWYYKLYHGYQIIKQKRLYKKNRANLGVVGAVRHVYKSVDNYMNKYRQREKPTITCKKGCSFCCSKEVFISDDEAKTLYSHMISNDIKVDLTKANYQALIKSELPLNYRECIFLDSKTKDCRVYDVRPLSCRMLLATTDPKFCLNDKLGKPLYFVLPEMENMKTAIWNSSISGVLPAMVLKQFKEAQP